MKKKFTTIILSMLMVMMFASAGVSALPAAPEGEDKKADNSEYWTVEATEVTESSALIVWNTADKEYLHQEDAVFNIYEVNGEDREVIAENIMSRTAAAEKAAEGQDEDLHVYVFNADEQAKDDNGKNIPLGYSFTLEKLDPDTGYELVVEKVEEGDYKTSGNVEFRTKAETPKTEAPKTETPKNESGQKSGGTKLSTAAAGYTLTPGGVYERKSPTTAEFRWWMNREPADGATVTINGRKVRPTKESDGTYSYHVTGLDPATVYKIPVKVIDRNGKTVSNVMDVWVDRYYKLIPGGVYERRSPTTAEFRWWMTHDVTDGATVTINGRKVKPTKESDGSYSYHVTGLDPATIYKIPVKVVDSNGRTLSNVMDVWVDKYYKLIPGGVYERKSPTIAEFRWWMSHDVADGATVTINGRKVKPWKNSDGTYSYNVSGLDPTRVYKIPVKIVDSNGRTLSNVMDVWVDSYYKISAGKVTSKSGSTAVFNWKMSRDLRDGDKVSINGHPVTPTKNSDGTYSYVVTGLVNGNIYNLPVKVVDRNGTALSNTIKITVDMWGETIRTMQVQFTFAEGRSLTDHTDGTVTTYFRPGYTTICTGYDNGRYQFVYNGRTYFVNRLSTTGAKIVSSAFDKTYSREVAENYVNKIRLESRTGKLIWVNTYTQKMYIFSGSTGNWKLIAGPWSVSTGAPSTMTSTGVARIKQQDYYNDYLYYWSVVSWFSIHGRLPEWPMGYPYSNGCVRNTDEHAGYVYYNCPIGTTVYVY